MPFCPYTILSIPFCPYHFVRYHFVRSPLHVLMFSKAVAVLGFCVWGAIGAGIFVWGAKGGLSAEGAKRRWQKAKSPPRLLGSGGVVSPPSGVGGGVPETDMIFNINSS